MNDDQQSPSRIQWFIHLPLVRIIIATLWLSVPLMVVQEVLRLLPVTDKDLRAIILVGPVILTTYFAYLTYVRFIEKRSLSELDFRGFLSELLKGALVGFLLFSLTIGIMWSLGFYTITGYNDWTVLLPMLSLALIAGFFEEVFFRGIIFRITEESLGTWIALAISALIFGLLHIFNPNATFFAALAIALEAGILLGAAYVLTRRLWFAIGIHLAWNFTQGGIYGVSVSGTEVQGILQSQLNGPAILSGGEFGAEASVFALLVATSAGVYFVWQAHRKQNFIKPFWKK